MKKYALIAIVIVFQWVLSAEETFKDIRAGGNFFVDSEGYIYTNSDQHSITRYSPSGKLLQTIGRDGEGPSDIKRLGGSAMNPLDKNIYIAEYYGGNKWISKFSSDGKYLGELNCEIDWKKWQGISSIQFDDSGNIYLQLVRTIPIPKKDFTLLPEETALVKFLPNGKLKKEIYKLYNNSFAEKGGKGNIRIPFGNYFYWNIYRERIIINECKDEYISIFDLDGNFKEKISLPFKKEKVTQKDLDAWEESVKSAEQIKRGIAEGWFDLKYWLTRLPFPEYKPVSMGRLYIDSHGFLYIMKASENNLSFTWSKINLNTRNVSIINSPPDEWLKAFWKDYVYITRVNEDDDYVIVKKNEKDFFKE